MSEYRAIAEYYDPEYETHPMLERDVPFMSRQMPQRRLSVLELAVGTARAAIPLAQAGHRVIGVDIDPQMLSIGEAKREKAGVSQQQLKLVEGDLLNLELGEKFDWVCLLFNSFLTFVSLEDQDKVLRGVVRHLKRRGTFWLDIFQPNLRILAEERSRNFDAYAFYVPGMDRTVFKYTEIVRDPARQVQHVTNHYSWFTSKGRERKEKRSFDITFIFPRELRMLLDRHGLKIVEMFGDYDGGGLDADSPRIIAKCCL